MQIEKVGIWGSSPEELAVERGLWGFGSIYLPDV